MTFVTESAAIGFWQACRDYLASKTDLNDVSELARVEDRQDPSTMTLPDFYLRLLKSLVNKQGMPQSIKVEPLSDLLCDFSPKNVASTYGLDWKKLFRTIKQEIKPTSRMRITIPQNYWVVFSRGALDGAAFLSGFKTEAAFASEVSRFAESDAFSAGLPKVLALEIHGYGFPLACDFLKECGWTQYAKADVHTKAILQHCGLADGSDYRTFRAIQTIARYVSETPYAVDKHIWLVGSGNLYNKKEKFQTSRDEFYRFLKRHPISR